MSGSESDDLEFRINTKFADNYDKWRRKEELQKLKDRYGDDLDEDSSSSSEEEDEDAEALTAQIEKDFLKTLSCVRRKDPKIYNPETTFYRSQDRDSEEEGVSAPSNQVKKKAKKEDKPVFLKDYERHIITEKGGRYSDDSGDEEEKGEKFNIRASSPTYVQEQEQIKESFKKVLQSSDSEMSDEESHLLKKRKRTPKEQKEEKEEYLQWMKGQKESLSEEGAKDDAAEMDALRKYWTDPSLEEGEKFLRDFILDKGYKEKDTPGEDTELLEEANFSEEERILDNQDDFERKYNFRYEEPDEEFIKRYPRTMASSVRVKDNKRSVKRQERKERKLEEKERKKDELKRLKNLKKQEIMDRLKKLQQVTGNTSTGFEDVDLEGDFDPQKHDQAMQKVFNEQYDALEEEETKPEFEHEDWEEENWDNWDGQGYDEDNYYEDEGHCEDDDFNMDADYDPSLSKQANKNRKAAIQQELIQASSKKKKKKMSKFAEALSAKKPVFDPADKTFEQYIDEFYKLDYEDMIGDLPCRFKYRQVVPNDFGLSTEEILMAKERELNQWASLKKTCQYRTEEEEENDKRFFAKKAKNEAKKKRIFLSLLESPDESEGSGDEGTKKKPAGNAKKKSQPLSKKQRKKRGKSETGSETPGRAEAQQATVEGNKKQRATKPIKQKSGSAGKQGGKETDAGLQTLIESEIETGKGTSSDHADRSDVREENSIVRPSKEKKKKKKKPKIENGDHLSDNVHSHSEKSQKPQKSKGTGESNDDATSSDKSTSNLKKRKRKRKVSEMRSDVQKSSLKTSTDTDSPQFDAVKSSITKDGKSDSQTQGSKKRKRKRKDSSSAQESALASASSSSKNLAPPPPKQKKSIKQSSTSSSENQQSKSTPKSGKPDKMKQKQKDTPTGKQRTQNKNRNRRRAKRVQQKEALKSKEKPTVSDARLKAYGIDPKKHVYRMRFLKEQEAKKKLAKSQ